LALPEDNTQWSVGLPWRDLIEKVDIIVMFLKQSSINFGLTSQVWAREYWSIGVMESIKT